MNFPNLLSLGRIALVPVFFYFIVFAVHDSFARGWALIIYAIAALTDALDGYLARSWGQVTALGEVIDPLADKLLVLSGFGGLLLTSLPVTKLPVWIVVIIFLREAVFAGGLLTFACLRQKMPAEPNFWGKATTLAQMLTVLACVIAFSEAILIASITAALTVVSGFIYTLRGVQALSRER